MMCLLCVRHRPKHFTVLTLNSPNNHYEVGRTYSKKLPRSSGTVLIALKDESSLVASSSPQ